MDRRLGLWHVFAKIGSRSLAREWRIANLAAGSSSDGSGGGRRADADGLDGGIYKGRSSVRLVSGRERREEHGLLVKGRTAGSGNSVRGLPLMTSAKFSDSLTLSPCPHLELISLLLYSGRVGWLVGWSVKL